MCNMCNITHINLNVRTFSQYWSPYSNFVHRNMGHMLLCLFALKYTIVGKIIKKTLFNTKPYYFTVLLVIESVKC